MLMLESGIFRRIEVSYTTVLSLRGLAYALASAPRSASSLPPSIWVLLSRFAALCQILKLVADWVLFFIKLRFIKSGAILHKRSDNSMVAGTGLEPVTFGL